MRPNRARDRGAQAAPVCSGVALLGRYHAVTTAQIAECAGVTERTYFRHFPDKREVLFDGENRLAEALTAALADVPPGIPVLLTLRQAFDAVVPMLEKNHPVSEPLLRIIAWRPPALWERAAAKDARLVEMLAVALTGRGTDEGLAVVATRAAWGALGQAVRRKMADPIGGLHSQVDLAFEQLREAVAALD